MEMEKMMERLLAKLEERMKSNAKTDKEEILARMKEDRKANQEDLLARMDAYHEKRMVMFDACFGQAEANADKVVQDSGMIQSVEGHQDIPIEDVAVIPVKGLRKRRRGPKVDCRATRRANGINPRKLWIPEKFGCRL
jgi:hypothetical protein